MAPTTTEQMASHILIPEDSALSNGLLDGEERAINAMESRVSMLMETALSGSEVDTKSMLMHQYATVAFEDGDDDSDDVDAVNMEYIDEESDGDDESSLEEAEEAKIAMLREQQQTRMEMEQAMESMHPRYPLDSDDHSLAVHDKGTSKRRSGLLKLESKEEFTSQELIQQKREMQQEMYAMLMMESSASPRAAPL